MRYESSSGPHEDPLGKARRGVGHACGADNTDEHFPASSRIHRDMIGVRGNNSFPWWSFDARERPYTASDRPPIAPPIVPPRRKVPVF